MIHNVAEVYFSNNQRKTSDFVGAVAYSPNQPIATFEYAKSWLAQGIELAPISMPLSEQKYQFRNLPEATFKGLPGMLADCLPDDFGNAVINAWLARQNRAIESFTAIERLLYTGQRGMGALEFKPSIGSRLKKSQPVQLDSLTQMAQAVLDERRGASSQLNNTDSDGLRDILLVGTSAGGARAKAVIAINQKHDQIVSGQVDIPSGFKHCLLKFDGVVESNQSQETFGDPAGFGRMEYAYYLMALDCGLTMMPCFLLEQGDLAHFVTERFDRIGNQKIHYQSLCAMAHADYKQPGLYSYEELFQLLRSLRLKRHEALQMFRRMAFNVIARNHDDHTKNFGFVFDQNHQWALAPAFDVAFSYKPGSPWVNSHQLSINGKRDDFTRDDLLAVIPNNLHKEAQLIIEQTVDVVSQWPKYSKQAGVFKKFSEFIANSHRVGI